ncbi:glycosyltransferase family 2 protein [Streptomyces sp. ISL-11]|uniref:glycosyltransferase family 2 protein n=1 Tax=Streptomyces sp. ISL-11 TaxID=2819174 RepID=UPI001BEA2FDD|nr:glycosyltransferase family 2 protein [Streptomyces sp. ISL-11]MBT2383749.1 glycosyltransferase family 2 protein [Streptomyces sp. ISL-11]
MRDAALLVVLITMAYNVPLALRGLFFARRSDASLRTQVTRDKRPPAPLPAGWSVFALVPCLNEERVIANTVRALLMEQPGVRVVVVDDGSDDATAALAAATGRGRITVVRRAPPEARRGKGAALNAGLRAIRSRAREEGLDPARVLVCVLDADGRMTPGAAARVVPLFEDPDVGGTQLAVRIRGRRHWALRCQDMEFWGLSAVGQFGRVATKSVSMAGNGQFTRLAALDGVGERPWSDSLTENLDLGISLAVRGWTVTSTTGAYVSQQGLTDPRRLLRQRTRWHQGHMGAILRLPELWFHSAAPFRARAELTGYLLVPYLTTLPWSVLQQYLLLATVRGHAARLAGLAGEPVGTAVWKGLAWYSVSFAPYLAWGLVYWRRSGDLPVWKALLYSHAQVLWIYLSFAAGWRAVWRLAARRTSWAKTEHAEEPLIAVRPPAALPSVTTRHP